MHIASNNGDTEMVKALVEAGADVRCKANGYGPMLPVGQWREIVTVWGKASRIAVKCGALGHLWLCRRTALELAKIGGHQSTVRALQAEDADEYGTDDDEIAAVTVVIDIGSHSTKVRSELSSFCR